MIKLDIHDYCNDCDGFEPIINPEVYCMHPVSSK